MTQTGGVPVLRWIGILLMMLMARTAPAQRASAAPPPNIIVFLVDDLGWQDTQVPLTGTPTAFNQRYRTPHQLAMAAAGMTFTDFYAAAPVCSPTRVTLITGQSPVRTRVTNWTQHENQETSEPYPLLLPPEWNRNGVSPVPMAHAFTGPLLPQLLRRAGYRTIHVGKAHWGAVGTPGADPMRLGFDVNIGGSGAGQPGSYLASKHFSSGPGDGQFRDVPGLERYWDTDTFLTEALTLEANRAIDEAVAQRKPFFLHFAQFAVHTPIEADARFLQHYLDAGLPPVEARYASLIEGVDKSLGDVLANVERHGLTNNTIVLFLSDNGGLSAHTRAPPQHVHNAPLRSGKGSAYEGGIRVPLIVTWPGHVRPASVSHAPTITDDLFPTLLRVAGVRDVASLTRGMLGRDLRGLLTGAGDGRSPRTTERPLLWHYPHFWGVNGPGIQPFSAVRVGRYKLIYFYGSKRYELYDVQSDLGETTDLVATRRADAVRLATLLQRSLQRAGAQLPIDSVTRRPVVIAPLR
ncbi:MAG: sulfatase [Gemmatimonadaceae bacterium]|nr:sulfatase [Gemmatimonadaceae bacterium]